GRIRHVARRLESSRTREGRVRASLSRPNDWTPGRREAAIPNGEPEIPRLQAWGSLNRPVDVGQEVLILVAELLVQRLDDVADRDDADQLVAGGDGHLGDPPAAHLAHDFLDVVVDAAGDRVAGHHVADRHPTEALAALVDNPQHVPLAEDPDELPVVVDHRQRADVVLDQLGDRLADGRLAVDRDDPASLGLQYVTHLHRALSLM